MVDDERLARERDFHDELARELSAEDLSPTPLGVLETALLDIAGNLRDRRILDLGCGVGDLTIELLRRGGRVTGLDLSPGMVEVARRRVHMYSLPDYADFVAAPVEEMPLGDESYDLVLGRFILHHLDLGPAAQAIHRVLRPGGRAIFIENSGRNRLLMIARDHVAGRAGIARYGTVDERPLSTQDIQSLAAPFAVARLHFPVFDFFRIFDRQVLRYRSDFVSKVLDGLDDQIQQRAPRLRQYSFRTVVELTK